VSRVLAGGKPHEHIEPDYDHPNAVAAYDVGWNTVVRSSCGHLYVRRYTYIAMLFPLCDHFPIWRRLRPWHLGGLRAAAAVRR
jgi:hypothetical protein